MPVLTALSWKQSITKDDDISAEVVQLLCAKCCNTQRGSKVQFLNDRPYHKQCCCRVQSYRRKAAHYQLLRPPMLRYTGKTILLLVHHASRRVPKKSQLFFRSLLTTCHCKWFLRCIRHSSLSSFLHHSHQCIIWVPSSCALSFVTYQACILQAWATR